jgi:hypothetical protein
MVSTVSVLLIPGVDVPCFRSVVEVQIGSEPAQYLRLLPSTSLRMSFPISPRACPPPYSATEGRMCENWRGGVYRHNNSKSYTIYELDIYNALSDFSIQSTLVQIGSDQITLGEGIRSDPAGATVRSLIAEMGMGNYTGLGFLGLDMRPTKIFSSNTGLESVPGMIERLVSSSTIPSHSWAYTAGSRWRKQLPTRPTVRN